MANYILDVLGIGNNSNPDSQSKPAIFENPFSFNGRIRRSEYGISLLLYLVLYIVMLSFYLPEDKNILAFFIVAFPVLWFLWAQGAKRCHDLGNSGWYQLIPFYVFWLVFQDGQREENEYGENPKKQVIKNENLVQYPINPQNHLASLDTVKPPPTQQIKQPVCAKCGCIHASGSDFGSMVDQCSTCGKAICRNCKKLEGYRQLCPLCGGDGWSIIL